MTKKTIKIGNKIVGSGQPVFIVAEAGVNHNGRLDLALKLIDAAADAGADAVKFQTFRAEQAASAGASLAGYQKKNTGSDKSLLEEARSWELKEKWYPKLIKHCQKNGVIFLSSPHGGFESVDFLKKLNIPAFKFSSGEINNLPVLAYAASLGRPIILATGTATLREVREAVSVIRKVRNNRIIILHCTTDYPCSLSDVNLRAMGTMRKRLGVLIGYSDHTIGEQVPVMACALGACVIEKHLTLNKNMPGPDHKISSMPREFKSMARKIRNVEVILGSAVKKPVTAELKHIPLIRKSIVANRDIKKGEILMAHNLAIKKPGTGIQPKHWHKIIGRIARRNIQADALIQKEDLA